MQKAQTEEFFIGKTPCLSFMLFLHDNNCSYNEVKSEI